jgi:hypothetical protein
MLLLLLLLVPAPSAGQHCLTEIDLKAVTDRLDEKDARLDEKDAMMKTMLEKKDEKDAEVEELKTIMMEMKTEKDAEVEEREGKYAEVEELKAIMMEMKTEKDAEVEELKTSLKEVKSELEEIGPRDLPTVIICAYKNVWKTTNGATLPYDRFITNFNNADRPNGGDGVNLANSELGQK